jgi:hypothetical protein
MLTDLMIKAEKYESKAARCQQSARAMAGPERAIYEVLAGYYSGLALDFRQVIERRSRSTPTPGGAAETMAAMPGRDEGRDPARFPEPAPAPSQLPHETPAMTVQVVAEDGSSA